MKAMPSTMSVDSFGFNGEKSPKAINAKHISSASQAKKTAAASARINFDCGYTRMKTLENNIQDS